MTSSPALRKTALDKTALNKSALAPGGAARTTKGESARTPGYLGNDIALIDLLDRLLHGGVMIQGDITLSVADIDLVKVDLRVLIASVDKVLGA